MALNRPAQTYIYSAVLLVFILYKSITTVSPSTKFIWVAVLLTSAVQFAGMLMKKHYIEVAGTDLIINRDFFRSKALPVHDIDYFKIEAGAFKSSYFAMKDQSIVKVVDNYFDLQELRQLLKRLSIRVE